MLAIELPRPGLSRANRGGQPAVAPDSIPGQGYLRSLPPPGSLLPIHPVSPARLGVREHRILRDPISIQCLGPTLQPRAGREALKDACDAGTP